MRGTYPAVGFSEATREFRATPFGLRFTGGLQIPSAGAYQFDIMAGGRFALMIDGRVVLQKVFNEEGNKPVSATVSLNSGRHDVDLRYTFDGGPARIEWLWTPPGGKRTLVPPSVLTPGAASWAQDERPDAPVAQLSLIDESALSTQTRPDAAFASGSELARPRGIAVDAQGNVFVGDRGHHRIVVYAPDGKIKKEWGTAANFANSQPPKPGEFADIIDVAAGSDDTIYVLDSTGNVQFFTADGNYKGYVDGQKEGMYSPNGIAVGADGSLYVADTGQNRLLKLSTSGGKSEVITGQGSNSSSGQFPLLQQPVDMVVEAGNLFAIDNLNRVVKLSQSGTIAQQWPLPTDTNAAGALLASNPDGTRIYMTDAVHNRIMVMDVVGGYTSFFGSTGDSPGQFTAPTGIAAGSDGRVYVVDGTGRIQVFKR